MSEEQKKIIKDLADKLPSMTERERGYLEGTIATAAAMSKKDLGMDKGTVRRGLQQGVFPWGYAVRTSENRWVYFINARRFAEIEGVSL